MRIRARQVLSKPGSARREFTLGMVASMGLKVAFTILSFMVTVVLARALGPDGYGIYAHVLALIMLLAIPAQVGLPTLLLRQLARYNVDEKWPLMRGILRWSNRFVVVISLVLMAIAGSIAWWTAAGTDPQKLATFACALGLIPLIALVNIRGAALRGLHHVLAGQLPEQLLRPGLLLLCLAAMLVVDWDWLTPASAMALHVLAAGVAFVVGLVLLRNALPAPARAAVPEFDNQAWRRSILPLSLIAGMQVINNQLGLVVLGFFVTDADVGIYRVASQAAILVASTLAAVNMVLAPSVARLFTRGDREQMQRMVTWNARLVLVAALPVVLVFVLFGDVVLRVAFGEAYVEGHAALMILSMGQLVNAATGSVGLILNMTGHERDTLVGMVCGAGVNILLSLVLIPPFGVEGAAWATALSLITWNIILCWQAYRRVGIVSTAFNWHLRG